METQIKALLKTSRGHKVITIFGYSTRGVPGLEINGVGKLSKNIKEKLIFLTRNRRLSIPMKRFIISVDINDLDESLEWSQLKWLEYPCLLAFWHLAGFIPISSLKDCISSGCVRVSGEISHYQNFSGNLKMIQSTMKPIEWKKLKIIGSRSEPSNNVIPSFKLLEHIEDLSFS